MNTATAVDNFRKAIEAAGLAPPPEKKRPTPQYDPTLEVMKTTMDTEKERSALLSVLYERVNGWLELRAMNREGKMVDRTFLRPDDAKGLTTFAARHKVNHLFFGVATRRDKTNGRAGNCLALSALWVDVDFKSVPEAEARKCLAECPFPPTAVLHTGGGLHVYWILKEPMGLPLDGAQARTLLRRLAQLLGGDLQSAEPARCLRLPESTNWKYPHAPQVRTEAWHPERRYLPSNFDAVLPPESADPLDNGAGVHGPGTIADGQRNVTLFKIARSLKAKGLSRAAIEGALHAENQERCQPPLDDREMSQIVESAWRQPDRPEFAGPSRHPQTDLPHAASPPPDESLVHQQSGFPLTDAGNAEYFAHRYGAQVRYDHRRRRWLHWQQHRWVPDADARIRRLAKAAMRTRLKDAANCHDQDGRAHQVRWALTSESRTRLDALIVLAQAEPLIADPGDNFDKNPWLLGVSNGVIDLRSGTLRAGHPDDRITMNAAVPFDPDATCPRWERFVHEVSGGDAEVITYLQRAIGYALTGLTTEQCLWLLFGTGANGKGTLLNTLMWILGDYAYNMPFSTIEQHQRSSIPNDVAALMGRRFVVASETNDGTRLNEARVKALTGCDPITARFLHSEFFTFEPVAKIWLAVNHKPVVRDDSHGFWRRIRLVPFTQQFAMNPALADELRAEGLGILAWAVRGCLAWQVEGLQPPSTVCNATREYEEDSDPLAAFLDEACDLSPDAEIKAGELYLHYVKWADRHHLNERERLSSTAFGRKISERFAYEKTRAGKTYRGVGQRIK